MAKRPGKQQVLGWLGVFIALPLGVWFAAGLKTEFHEKSLSNLSLEPALVAVLSIVVFAAWYLLAQRLRPSVGIVLLIILAAAALAVQHFVPSLRE